MNCTRTAPKTRWTNVGYSAAKRGLTFDAVRIPGDGKIANQWILDGMAKYNRKMRETRRGPHDLLQMPGR